MLLKRNENMDKRMDKACINTHKKRETSKCS